jgi:anti-anti-sigma regulatory factor
VKEIGAQMKICGLQRDVKFVLEFTKLNETFEIHPDRDSALESYGVKTYNQ